MIALLAEVLQFPNQEIPPLFVQPNLKLTRRGQVNGYSRCHDVPLRLRANINPNSAWFSLANLNAAARILVVPVSRPKVQCRINHASTAEFRMRKERHKPPQVRPRLLDRMQLAMSTARHVDGIWIGSWRTPEDLTRVERALLLVKQHSPLHYSRIISDLERIWIFLLPDGLAEYNHSLKACVLDERYVADSATSVEQIASTIVHEATHARLERYGIRYQEDQRARIEAIC